MAKKFILTGILVLSLVFAMTVIACGGGDDTPVIFPVTPPNGGEGDGNQNGEDTTFDPQQLVGK